MLFGIYGVTGMSADKPNIVFSPLDIGEEEINEVADAAHALVVVYHGAK